MADKTPNPVMQRKQGGFQRFLSRLKKQGSKVGYGGKAGSYFESGKKKKARYDKMSGIKE